MNILPASQRIAIVFQTHSPTISLVTKDDDVEEWNEFPLHKKVKQVAYMNKKRLLVSGEDEIFMYDLENKGIHSDIISSPKAGYRPCGLCVNQHTNSIWVGFWKSDTQRYYGVISRYQIDTFAKTVTFGDRIDTQMPIKIKTNELGSVVGILVERMDDNHEIILLTAEKEVIHRCSTKQGEPSIEDMAISEDGNAYILLTSFDIFLLKKADYMFGAKSDFFGRPILKETKCVSIGIKFDTLWLLYESNTVRIRRLKGVYEDSTVFSDTERKKSSLESLLDPVHQDDKDAKDSTEFSDTERENSPMESLLDPVHEEDKDAKDSSGVFSDTDKLTTSLESLLESVDERNEEGASNENKGNLLHSFLEDSNEKHHLMMDTEDLDRLIDDFCQNNKFEKTKIEEIRKEIKRDTHLHFAMKYFHKDLLRQMLRSNADLSKKGYNNDFPFQAVAEKERFQCVYNILCEHFKEAVIEMYTDISTFVWKVNVCYCDMTRQKCGLAIVVHISRNTSIANFPETNTINKVNVVFVFHKDVNLEARTVQMHEQMEDRQCNFGVESKTAEELFTKHSNLNAIRSSPLRSLRFGTPEHRIIQQSCIILYCSKKGYIPINEEAFPTEINGIRTDVREGYFMFGADKLQHGDAIFRASKSGTLGGFVEFSDKSLGFITCAHVLFSIHELYNLRSGGFSKEFPSHVFKNTKSVGNIVDATFITDNGSEGSIDAALVKVVSERFVDLSYPEIHDLKGLTRAPLFRVPPDSVASASHLHQGTNRVIKYGHSTGFTVGTLQFDSKSHVRIANKELQMNENPSSDSMDVDDGNSFKMFNQLCVSPSMNHIFFSAGDSGAFVYLLCDPKECTYQCIGMAIGELSDGICLVTEIESILNSFQDNLTLRIPMQRFEDEYVTKDVLKGELSKEFSSLGAKLDKMMEKMTSIDNRVRRLEEKTKDENGNAN